jgi:hypothetical protein
VQSAPAMKIFNCRRARQFSSARMSLDELLDEFSLDMDCADVRDHVYALLSLMDEKQRERLGITPNYACSPAGLMEEVLEAFRRTGRFYANNAQNTITRLLYRALKPDLEDAEQEDVRMIFTSRGNQRGVARQHRCAHPSEQSSSTSSAATSPTTSDSLFDIPEVVEGTSGTSTDTQVVDRPSRTGTPPTNILDDLAAQWRMEAAATYGRRPRRREVVRVSQTPETPRVSRRTRSRSCRLTRRFLSHIRTPRRIPMSNRRACLLPAPRLEGKAC